MPDSIYKTCSTCEKQVGPRNESGLCRSCAKKKVWAELTPEKRESWRRNIAIVNSKNRSGGRPKGSKNSVPYVRTKVSVSDPWWLHTKESRRKQRETMRNKSDEEIAAIMERSLRTKIANGTTGMVKTYKGVYKVKNPAKYRGDHTKVIYRSMWERHVMKHLDESEQVVEWSSEEVVIPYLYEVDHAYHRYFPDFLVKYTNGKTILIEVKPAKETKAPTGTKRTKQYIREGFFWIKNNNKWEAAQKYSQERGWIFEIWTEKTLTAKGIMPKPLKKMKPMAKYSKKKTKR